MLLWIPMLPWVACAALLLPPVVRLVASNERSQEWFSSVCRQLCLNGLMVLGLMTLCCVAREDIAWIWWASSLAMLAIVVSWDSQRPVAIRVPVASKAEREGSSLERP
ncbi:MAG: hypothetical protein VX644_11145 [Planctomycetota bacterium]|nr:hypothetical protein [Planctomycetota bacterium]